jgi:hypothetical protein
MNARQRRKLSRMKNKPSSVTQLAHSTDHKGSQADKVDHGPLPPETRLGHGLKVAKRSAQAIGAVLVFLATILGLVTGYIALLPRVSVSQNEQLDPSDPFSSPFVVSNDGPLPMERVRFRCGIVSASYEHGPKVEGGSNFGSSFIFAPDASGNMPPQNFGAVEMNPGERSTIPSCNYPFPKSVAGANIGIIVTFRIGYTPFSSKRTFRFVTLADSNKKLHWYPYPIK